MFRDIVSNELFTIFIVTGFITVAVTKLIAPKRFNDFVGVLGNSKYLKIYSREQKFFDKFEALLFFNLLLSASVFIYTIYQQTTNTNQVSIDIVTKLGLGIGLFILIKVMVERLIGSLFEIEKLTELYLFQKITYKNFLGIILLPLNALLIFSFIPKLTLIYIIVILLLIVNIIGLITTIKTHQSLIKNSFFYFILYLCALEIAPYIILYKVFTSN
jgi:hypothetical protein